MGLSTDVRTFWPSTAASIPANWSRDTDYDGVFFQGSSSAGSTGGGATHDHTASPHTHTGNSHTHILPALSTGSTGTVTVNAVSGTIAADGHTHGAQNVEIATITYQSTVATINGDAGQPPYMQVIVIAPDDGNQEIPIGAVVFTDQTAAPGRFAICDGNGGTVDLDGRFLLGAAGAGDGGGVGGSGTHSHVSPAHDHVVDDHSHADTAFASASSSQPYQRGSAVNTCSLFHHTFTSISTESTDVNTTAITVNTASSEPAYTELLAIQNVGPSADTPDRVIVGFVGAGAVPSGWLECNGQGTTLDLTGSQIKCTETGADVGNTGGANSHTHTTNAHLHTQTGSHFHTGTTTTATGPGSNSGAQAVASTAHTHGLASNQTQVATPTLQNAIVVIAANDGRYSYRTIRWIRKEPTAPSVQIRGNTQILGNTVLAGI